VAFAFDALAKSAASSRVVIFVTALLLEQPQFALAQPRIELAQPHEPPPVSLSTDQGMILR